MYLNVRGLCHSVLDAIGTVRAVGRAEGEAHRLRQFERFFRLKGPERHDKVGRGRGSDVAGRL